MIRQLLSRFKTFPEAYCSLSETGRENLRVVANLSFFYAQKTLLFFTFFWLVFITYNFSLIKQRPIEVFEPMHWFGRIFMDTFPPSFVVYFALLLSAGLIGLILFIKDSMIYRAVLTFCLLWLNVIQWSYGFQSVVGHLLLLSHLFGIFIPVNQILKNPSNEEIYKSIQWYYLGVLITYSYAGVWKWIGLFYKVIFKSNEVNWLSPKAALFNSLVSYHQIDSELSGIPAYFTFPLFWQISFLIMSYIQTFIVFAAFRQPFKYWVGAALIIFHIVNGIAFNIWFHAAVFVIICLFFPYSEILVFRIKQANMNIVKREFHGLKFNAHYKRYYANGDVDEFNSFFAIRENYIDKRSLLGGVLYTPFIDVFVELYWKFELVIKSRLSIRKSNSV